MRLKSCLMACGHLIDYHQLCTRAPREFLGMLITFIGSTDTSHPRYPPIPSHALLLFVFKTQTPSSPITLHSWRPSLYFLFLRHKTESLVKKSHKRHRWVRGRRRRVEWFLKNGMAGSWTMYLNSVKEILYNRRSVRI